MTAAQKALGLRGNAARTNITVGALLVLVIAGFVNYLSFRHFERWDLTSTARFAVSSRTRAVVRGLSKDVKIYLFLSERDPSYTDVRELLRKYQSMSSHLTVSILDPDEDAGRYTMLAQRFGIRTAQSEEGVIANVAAVIVSGDRTHKIESSDFMSAAGMGEDNAPAVDVKTERALTSGIVAVTRGRNTKVCIATGHGEWAREGEGPRTLGEIAEGFLELDNIELEDLALTPTATIPRTCDAVFVIGPQRVFEEGIATKLGAYARAGGHLLIAVDPIFRDQSSLLPTGLESMLAGFGILVGTDIVVERDADHQLSGGPVEVVIENDMTEHPITSALRAAQGGVAMRLMRSVSVREGSSAEVILRASEESYGETDLASLQGSADLAPGDGDVRGPVGLAAAWSSSQDANDTRAGRIVVIGDADLFEVALLNEPRFGNFDFLSGVTGFLTARPQLITIAPRRTSARSIRATSGDVINIGVRVLLLVPLAFALLGFSVWWSRRA